MIYVQLQISCTLPLTNFFLEGSPLVNGLAGAGPQGEKPSKEQYDRIVKYTQVMS